jgi:hypothetical protein
VVFARIAEVCGVVVAVALGDAAAEGDGDGETEGEGDAEGAAWAGSAVLVRATTRAAAA